jgi:class 3 adenylate cyclase/tetratricopeptide (TPR) repeat protein
MDTRERTTETERRRATVLFTDITGFTALTESLDPEEASAITSECLMRLDRIARKHGGSVDKYLGDCIMAMFGVPFAVEDAPKAAINAAIEMHNGMREFNREREIEKPLDVHTGINTGLVISKDVSGPVIREFAVLGDAVNTAARLKDLAPRGEIWVGGETYRETRDAFEFEAKDELALKGKKQRVAVYAVLSRKESLHRPAIEAHSTVTSRFIGRNAEISRLRRSVQELRNGTGGVVNIIAEAGLGKSRLISELAASEEAQQTTWLEGRSLAIGLNLSFHPFSDLLRSWAHIPDGESESDAFTRFETSVSELFEGREQDVLPFLASMMGLALPESQRQRLQSIDAGAMERLVLRATTQFLKQLAARGPTVVVMEDVHWADRSSLELLSSLLRLAAAHRLLFVNALRPDPAEAQEWLSQAISAGAPHGLRGEEVRLAPLDRGAAEELIDHHFERGDIPRSIRSRIEERTVGNPFYIEQVVRSLIDEGTVEQRDGALWATEQIESIEIPANVRDVLMARIDRFPLRTRRVVQIASIAGQSCDERILSHLIEGEELDEDLATLVSAQLLLRRERFGEISYEFKHPLIQETVYEAISLARRAEYHSLVGDTIEAALPESQPGYYGMLAYHFSLAKDAKRAERYLILAGDQAASLAASSEALHLLQEAARLYFELHGEGGDPFTKALLEKKIALAFFNRGRMVEGDQHFDRALVLLGKRVPRSDLGRKLRFVGSLLSVLADLFVSRRFKRPRRATDEDREAIEITFLRAQAQTISDPTRFVMDSIDGIRQLNSVDPTRIDRAGGQYAGCVAFFAYTGVLFGVGSRLLRRAEPLVDEQDPREMLLYRFLDFIHNFMLGDWSEQHTATRELVEENLRLGDLWNVVNYVAMDAKRKLHQGRFSEAAEDLERVEKIQELYDYDLAKSNACAVRMFLELERRDLEAALRAAKVYYDGFDEHLLNLLALGSKAKIEILLGEREAAAETLQRAAKIVRRPGFLLPFHLSGYLLAVFWLDLLELEDAVAGGRRTGTWRLRRRARRSGRRAVRKAHKVAWQRPETYCLYGRWAWLAGRRRKALRWWGRSVDAAEQLGTQPELGRTYLEIGRRLDEEPGGRNFRGMNAERCFEQAFDIFDALGLHWDLERLQEARAGSPRPSE